METGDDNFGGREKKRGWKRKSTDDKYREVEDLFGEKETLLPAKVLHIGSRLPKEAVRPKSAPNNQPKENKPAPALGTDSVPVADARELLPVESEEENPTGVEERIEKEFNDSEKEFKNLLIGSYSKELQTAKKKIKDGGGVADEKWAANFRLSYINDRMRWGMDKKRWGTNGPLQPKKAELLEKFLELKLPIGIPKEKTRDKPKDAEEIKLLREQRSELVHLITEAVKFKNQFDESQMEQVVKTVFEEDLVLKRLFPGDQLSQAISHIMKQVNKFRDKK